MWKRTNIRYQWPEGTYGGSGGRAGIWVGVDRPQRVFLKGIFASKIPRKEKNIPRKQAGGRRAQARGITTVSHLKSDEPKGGVLSRRSCLNGGQVGSTAAF